MSFFSVDFVHNCRSISERSVSIGKSNVSGLRLLKAYDFTDGFFIFWFPVQFVGATARNQQQRIKQTRTQANHFIQCRKYLENFWIRWKLRKKNKNYLIFISFFNFMRTFRFICLFFFSLNESKFIRWRLCVCIFYFFGPELCPCGGNTNYHIPISLNYCCAIALAIAIGCCRCRCRWLCCWWQMQYEI